VGNHQSEENSVIYSMHGKNGSTGVVCVFPLFRGFMAGGGAGRGKENWGARETPSGLLVKRKVIWGHASRVGKKRTRKEGGEKG